MTQSIDTTERKRVARPVVTTARGVPTSDGAGVKLTRIIGTSRLKRIDPFLMLDEFRSDRPEDYIAGFPPHPHRGFETFTYMLAGTFRHRDNHGNEGVVAAGGGQWMTAGRGIVHSEMPEQEEGLVWGFQLWINLPRAEKMRAPEYRDLSSRDIPLVRLDGSFSIEPTSDVAAKRRHDIALARLVAGRLGDVVGPIDDRTTEPFFAEVILPRGVEAIVPIPTGHDVFVYPFEGDVELGALDAARALTRGELAVLGAGDHVRLRGATDARALVVAGRPIGEPVVQYGPFVMNAPHELEEAIRDFQSGKF